VAGFSVEKAGGLINLVQQIPPDKWVIFHHPKAHYYLAMFFVWSFFPVVHLSPPSIQRILMAPDAKRAKYAFLVGAFVQPIFMIVIILIGFSALVAYPDIKPESVFPFLVQEAVPKGLQGFAIIAVLSVVMSTADSLLHSAGLVITHNIIKPICDKRNVKLNELRWVRVVTAFSGFVSIIVAIKVNNIYNLGLIGGGLFGPLIIIPLIAGVMGLKVDERTFFISFFATIATFIIARFILSGQALYLAIPISIFANAISFFLAHFIQNKGFTRSQPKKYSPTLKPYDQSDV